MEILGYPLPKKLREARHAIGYMPDMTGLYEELTLDEYLSLFAGLYGLSSREASVASQAVMELLRIEKMKTRRLKGLSRGETQRVLLARAIVHDPAVFILDEPAAGLDPRARTEFRQILKILNERGKTILVSSHILSDLEEICDQFLLIDRGRLIFCGSKEEMRSQGIRLAQISIEVIAGQDRIAGILEAFPDVSVSSEAAGRIELEVPDDAPLAGEILKELISGGVLVSSFARRRESLDDIYLRMTQEEPL